jgi:hypothetical protein
MSKLRSLVIDDEPNARMRLRRLLSDDDRVEVIGEAKDGLEAVAEIQRLRPDLVFLDVQMPGLERPGKTGGYPNFASDVSCVPGCRGDSVARHSSFKTWSRLGVGDRLRGSHLDRDQVSLSSQPPVFPGLQVRRSRSFLSQLITHFGGSPALLMT